MTQEEKSLLLENLCARLPYGVNVNHKGLVRPLFSVSPTQHYQITLDNAIDGKHNGLELVSLDDAVELKLYLRPMSSMTEEEKKELQEKYVIHFSYETIRLRYHWDNDLETSFADYLLMGIWLKNWFNKKMFDYRGLIPMGLALEAPEGMYNQ